ncbi:MAG: hypothetical protein J6J29_04565 [Paludibacteraceae bacterium]|nr:hypothetical protein [Paludibacteraceae bacterium]
MKKTLTILAAFFAGFVSLAYAQRPSRVPAYPGIINRVQPDTGDTLQIYLRGDERKHYAMTVDGWQVMENDKGILCYVTQKGEEKKVSNKRAHNAAERSCCETRWLERHGIKHTNDDSL